MQDKERLEDMDLHKTVFWLLDKMEKIARRDLLNFLRTHNIRLPLKRRDQVLEKILERTGGRYESTIEELKNLVDRAWNLAAEEAPEMEQLAENDYDY